MNRNTKIAAAVAAILSAGAAGNAIAAVPSLGQAASSQNVLYIAGSSAAKNGVLGAIENDLCGGASNSLIVSSSGDTNFFAVSCIPASGTGNLSNANGTNVFTVYYRDEGGSVTGALPLVSGSAIQQLNLSASGVSCSGNTCTAPVGGTTANNGTTDTFTGTTGQKVGLGITDVEPGALIGDNYPTAYSPSAYGKATATQLGALTQFSAFQQVFGIFVNKSGLNTPICLSSQAVSGLLNGSVDDWHKVEDCATHVPVASSSVPVTIVNREAGSGTRTAASIFWLNDECDPNNGGIPEDQATDYFSTGGVLQAAATTNGAVTYASIDQNGAQPNLVLASIDGVAPTNLAAAQGQYPWWEEATLNLPNYNASLPTSEQALANFFITDLANGNTAPHTAQVNLIPGAGANTTASLPVSGTANTCSNSTCSVSTSTAIYVNPFTKSKVSCSAPTNTII